MILHLLIPTYNNHDVFVVVDFIFSLLLYYYNYLFTNNQLLTITIGLVHVYSISFSISSRKNPYSLLVALGGSDNSAEGDLYLDDGLSKG